MNPIKRLCVVGSGPAGFYTAYRVLKHVPNVQVDMLEALPVPYGLVRYGVAPDHPEVKAVQHKFEEIASDPRFSFIGNIKLGVDVSVQQLRQRYDSLVLAYGASKDRTLGIPGEMNLRGVLAARDFVGWYNGQPNHRHLCPDLQRSSDTAVVIGNGNVALDVARILLTPIDQLAKTDIAQYALDMLAESKIRRVLLVGRRGPVQAAFTARELREMFNLPAVVVELDRKLISEHRNQFADLLQRDRARRRLIELMESYRPPPAGVTKHCKVEFLMKPVEFLADADHPAHVGAVRLERTKLLAGGEGAVGTGEFEEIKCGLVLRSIGYKSIAVSGAPFDQQRGLVPNIQGRVVESSDAHADFIPGLYVAGWLKTGPMGVIATTMYDAYQTADCIIADLKAGVVGAHAQGAVSSSRQELLDWLRTVQNARPVTFADWKRVEQEEERRGKLLGKPREKLSSVEDILRVIDELNGRAAGQQ